MWELGNQLPAASGAGGCMASSQDGTWQFAYELVWGWFYRFDTWNNWHGERLASPIIAPVTGSTMCYTSDEGYRANSLSIDTSATSMTIPATNSQILIGKEIEITTGTGLGEKRVITDVSDIYILDSGVATAVTGSVSITDSTKRYEINQFIGYSVRLVFGNGLTQVRRILYNNENTLTFYDVNYQQLDPWNNTALVVAPAVATGYYIEACDVSWTTPIPAIDTSTSYFINTGGVWLLSATASAPWSSFQFYDNLTDTWTIKTAIGGQLLAALGTDFSLEILSKGTPYTSNVWAISATSRTLVDAGQTLAVDRYCNYSIHITGGTGMGQKQRIVANGATYFEIAKPWEFTPDSTSTYEIHGDTDAMYLIGNGASVIHAYSRKFDMWYTGPLVDVGQVRNISAKFPGQEANGVTSIVRNTGGITVLNATPTAGGTGYVKWDLFNITTGGTVGKWRVESVSAGWVVTSISLYSAGLTYTTGAGKATTPIAPAVGTGLTVNITTVGTVWRVTTTGSTNFYKADPITIAGCTDALYNTTFNILAIDSLSTFDIIITAAASAVATASQSTTLIVDPTKNWTVNEHVGRIVKLDIAGNAPTSQYRRITSNTATSLTVATIVAGVNGTSRYTIAWPESFGIHRQYNSLVENWEGRATGGSTTTLIDTTKIWAVNQWVWYRMRILAGTGVNINPEIVITANTIDTLTITTPGFTPDSTTKYMIMEGFGTATAGSTTTITDTSKNFIPGSLVGKQVVLTAGTGQRTTVIVTVNTATVITFVAITPVVDTTTTYSILAMTVRWAWCNMRWINGNTNVDTKGKYMLMVRGWATNVIDLFDISRNYIELSILYSPKTATITTGSSFTYNGEDIFYFTTTVLNDFIYVYGLNINTMQVVAMYQTTAIQAWALHIGDFLMFIKSPDGIKFLIMGLCTSRVTYKLQII